MVERAGRYDDVVRRLAALNVDGAPGPGAVVGPGQDPNYSCHLLSIFNYQTLAEEL